MNLIAQTDNVFGSPISGQGPLGNPGTNAPTLFNTFISNIIGIMTAIAAIWFVFLVVLGAIGIITAGGDKTALEEARNKITHGLIGIIVVIAAVFLVDLVGNLLGVPNLLNPGSFVQNLTF